MKQNKKKIGLVLTSALAASGAVVGALVGLASCSNGVSAIPVKYLNTDANGLVTGIKDGVTTEELNKYNTLVIPEKDANGNAIKGIAANAFKDKFKSGTINSENSLTVVIKKNVAKIGSQAFFGCTAITTIDLTDFETADAIFTLFEDKNMGENAFAVTNTKKQGTLKLNSKITSAEDINDIKTCLVVAGVPMDWFKEGESPTISKLTMVGGSTHLEGKQYFASNDQNPWVVKYGNAEVVSKDCNYTISPISEDFPIGKITVEKDVAAEGAARVKWSHDITPGTYTFQINATYIRAGEETALRTVTSVIGLKINATSFKLTGPSSFSGKSFKPGTDTDNPFETYVESTKVQPEFSIINSSAPVGQITIDNQGVVSWGEIGVGTYSFYVKAVYHLHDEFGNVSELTKTSDVIILGISDRVVHFTYPTFPMLTELEAGTSLTPFQATVQDNSYNSNATVWTLHPISGPTLTSIKIDSKTGYISWDNNIPWGEYKFYVKANVDGKWEGTSQTVTLNFGEKFANITGGETTLDSDDYTSGIGAKRQLIVDGRVVDNATWSLEKINDPIPTGIKINTQGQVYWDETLPAGTYKFNVHGHSASFYGHERNAYQEVTLNVAVKQYTIEGGNYTLNSDEYTQDQDTKNWVAKGKVTSTETYKWHLESSDGGTLPAGLTIDDNGFVKWDDTLHSGTYRFYVCVTVNGHWHAKTFKPVVLSLTSKYLAIEDTGISDIESKDYTAGSSTGSIKVLLKGDVKQTSMDVTKQSTFEIINRGATALPASLAVDKNTGKVTWGDDVAAGTYTFAIKASYTYHGKTIATNLSKDINFTVTEVDIGITQSIAHIDFKGDVNASKVDKSTKFSLTKDGQAYTQMSNVVWHFTDSTGEVPVLEGKLHMTSDGYLSWDAIAAGTYEFYIWAVVENKWWGSFASKVTLEIKAEHALDNSDLEIEGKKVVGLKTDISGYKYDTTLTINIDGTTIEDITSLRNITNNKVIRELTITNNSVEPLVLNATQSDPMFDLSNLTKITLKNASTGSIKVGQYAFNRGSYSTVTTLDLDSVSVDTHAFSQWHALSDVKLASIKELGIGAFYDAGASAGMTVNGLAQILADDTTTLGTNVFESSTLLFTDELSISRSKIPNYFFSECQNFSPKLVVTAGTEIGEYAFANTLTTAVEFDTGATGAKVGTNAFSGCAILQSLTFKTTINTILNNAFLACPSLTLIDVSTLTPSSVADALVATNTAANAFNGVAANGEFKCKDKVYASRWMQSMYGKYALPTSWLFSPEGAWTIRYNASSDITFTTQPQFIVFNDKLTINYTLPATRQLKKSSCQVSWGSTVLNDATEALYPEAFSLTNGQVVIDLLTLESKGIAMPTNGQEVIITLESMNKQDITFAGSKTFLAEQTESLSSNFVAYVRQFTTTNVDISKLTVSGVFKKDGEVVSTDAYKLAIQKAGNDAFNLKVTVLKDAIAQSGFKLDGSFTFTDTVNHTSWTINDFVIYVDYQTKVLTDVDFVTSSGVITELRSDRQLESNYYYNIELELDGTTRINIGDNLFNTVTNGNMINSIKIVNKSANTNQIILAPSMFKACTDLRHLILVNEASSPSKMIIQNQILPEECWEDMLDIEVDNLDVTNGFYGMNNVNKITIGKGTVLGTGAFSNLGYVQTIDLSTWDEVTTTEDWSQACFINLATYTTGNKYIKVYSETAKQLWSSYFTTLGCLDPAKWTFKY